MAHQIGKWLHTLNSSASISISYLIDELKSSLHKYTEWSTQLKAEEKTQFFGDLINAIENTFSFYNVHIHSDERIEAIKNGENPEELSIIYGKLYDELADLLSNVLGITR